MPFTALHRALGLEPSPVTDELITEAVARGVAETDDLDWKSSLPPIGNLAQTDFPKDVAAMANTGGGIIIFGVTETEKAATTRVDAGELTEQHERALRAVAASAISPPVFGLTIQRFGDEGARAVVVEVPASVDVPHLIYANHYFGAPLRNDADTVWMKERQLETMYRARFEGRLNTTAALEGLYDEVASLVDATKHAWLVAVARPAVEGARHELTKHEARQAFIEADGTGARLMIRSVFHPLDDVYLQNPRPGLRRWNDSGSEHSNNMEDYTTASLHRDGAVTLSTIIGGQQVTNDTHLEPWQIRSVDLEAAAADIVALAATAARLSGVREYDIRVGIEWAGVRMEIGMADGRGYHADQGAAPARFLPVSTTMDVARDEDDLRLSVRELALDCVNQGGVTELVLFHPRDRGW